ncbi:cytoskeleton assembly control protein sla1 [Stemphylium lycopersici]|nr:cytoskeleton assembly control protein sla1 [Stemphylium lycopersici]
MPKGPPSHCSEEESVREVQPDDDDEEEEEEQEAIIGNSRDEIEEEWRSSVRLKVDLRLCSIAGILCSLNLLDSGVISSASVTSMLSDLELDVGNRYSVSIFIFTIASIAFQLPSTIAVRTFGPRIWFAFITCCFGLVTICTAFVTTWRQMIALRILLGIAMSGIYPGLTYLISTWYTRKEQQLRFALMQSGEVIVLATGGIVNYGLNRLDGTYLKGWQWMFVVQGSITAFIGILTYWWMVDFPERAHESFYFLTAHESALASSRIEKDRGDVEPDPFAWSKIFVHAKDAKVYGFCVLYFLQNVVSTSLGYFLPIILQGGMGFSSGKSILLSAPPYYYAVLPAILSSLVGDKFQLRGPIIVFNCVSLIVGFGMLGFSSQVTVRYIGTYLATGAYVANWAAMATYQANNIVGQWKRVFTAAIVTAFNGAGGIAGSFIVRQPESPRYMTAVWSSNEITLNEGDVLMVLEKSTDDAWWTAKKKGTAEDEEEPEGLIPNNYIEEAAPIAQAKALFDYDRQTDEELSFKEDALLDVYDTTDPDWTLVGVDNDYGFAPANYIELIKGGSGAAPAVASPTLPSRPPMPPMTDSFDDSQPPTPDSPPRPSPATALASIIKEKSQETAPRSTISPPPNVSAPPKRRVQFTPEESDEEIPPPRLPQRPESELYSPPPTQHAHPRSPSPPVRSPPPRSVTFDQYDPPSREEQPATPMSGSGYHLYNIYEYITQPGKNKKMPITLGVNIPKGMVMIAPEKSRDGPQQEWSADKMEYYSQEGKHIFMELKQPSKSVDFHCGAKDTASEIMLALGELAGAAKSAGLREVLAAGSGNSNVQKKGVMLFDFMAQGDDEVTVGLGDEILVLDDSASDEWWKVRRLKNGKEGVVPANYVDITETIPVHAPAAAVARSGTNAGRSVVEQNRREEEELARQASRRKRTESEARNDQVGPGLHLPLRNSSLMQTNIDHRRTSQRSSKRESSSKDSGSKSTSKPNSAKVRTWTDRSGSFKVEAEFILIKDGKIHLHKVNGVKIAVPVTKMSVEDLEYVENVTGESLDDDKPLSDLKRKSTQKQRPNESDKRSPTGISVEKKPEYDWFDFFLKCGVNPQICERYARAFVKDEMTEENIPDITPGLLRTLGLKEGDILRVTKHVDAQFGRDKRNGNSAEDGGEGGSGGLFSGPGGALRNNTRKGRPAPPVETNDVVDPKAFERKSDDASKKPAEGTPTPLASAPAPDSKTNGFEDNAWDVKPSKSTPASPPPAQAAPPAAKPPQLTGSMGELSLLDMPALKPEEIAQPTPPAPAPAPAQAPAQQPPAPQQQPQPTGATPTLFEQVAAIKALTQPQNMAPPRMRPQAPQQQGPGGLIAPPPQRSSSAPQNPQQSAFGPPPPLQPQLTGYNPNMMAQNPGQGPVMQGMQPQMTGFPQQNGGYGFQQNGMMPQPTGYNPMSPPQQQPMQTGFAPFQQPQPTGFQQPMQTGYQQQQPHFTQGFGNGSPFADPPRAPYQPLQAQPTGYNSFQPSPLNPQATGVNRFLPPALAPQPTGFGQSPPPVPPMPPMPSHTPQPLVPQKTGPPPSIKFGVQPAKKLTPQPTGRANLANATPQNPFGF